jgi:hypothetical protein
LRNQQVLSHTRIPCILRNSGVYYCIHYSPSSVCISSQISPVYLAHPTCWRSILKLSSHLSLGFTSGPFLSGFLTKWMYAVISHTYLTCSTISVFWFGHPNNICWGLPIIKLFTLQSSPLRFLLRSPWVKIASSVKFFRHSQPHCWGPNFTHMWKDTLL